MNAAFLDIESLSKRFGGLTVLTDVNLVIPQGGIFGLIGPNGAGKTTLFNLMTGILGPDTGRVRFRGEALSGMPPHQVTRRGLSRTFQNIRLFKEMTLIENVIVGMHGRLGYSVFDAVRRSANFRRVEESARARAHELLTWVSLAEKAGELAGNLSYGDQRKLELARALAAEPALLLLDEPVAGMNTAEKFELMNEIRQIAARGYTVLLIDHDMKFVMGLCQRIAVLNFGRIIAEGTGDEIRRHPDVIEAYLGRDDEEDEAVPQGAMP
ncbi:MAG: ABC transporter ATP-binding protein [Pseudomonadota bacterium]